MATSAPTTESGRTIAAMYEAFGRGDVPFVLERIAPSVDWIETKAENIPPLQTRSRAPPPESRNRPCVAGLL
jgi:hypothetical protein